MDPFEAMLRLAEARVAVLATVRRDGTPHTVPIVFSLSGRRLFTAVDTKPKTTGALQRLDNIRANPAASVLAQDYGEDWSRLWWVRADGPARVVDDGPDLQTGIELLAAKYPQYRESPVPGPAIVIDIERVIGWTAG